MFMLKFKTSNAAFSESEDAANDGAREQEIARILRDIATCVEQGHVYGVATDYNGNKVGTWEAK